MVYQEVEQQIAKPDWVLAPSEPRFWPISVLLETADIGGGDILENLCDPQSQTHQALEKLGLVSMRLAGSITLGSGNFYCSVFDEFSRSIVSINSGKPVRVKHPTGDLSIDNSWQLTRALGIDNLPENSPEAQSFSQLLDFLTGRNADLLIKLNIAPDEASITAVYDALIANLPQDVDRGKYIISLAKHAGRLPVIQIHDTQDRYNQGINLIFETPGDTWNSSTTGRIDEVVDILVENGRPGIYVSHDPKRESSRLLKTPSSLGELLAIFSQELRRSILYPDRNGINLDSYRKHLADISNLEITHEQACLITANLSRALARDQKYVEQVLQDLKIEHYFHQNDPEIIKVYLVRALRQIFDDSPSIPPYLVKLFATALPMPIEEFLKLKPTPHPVLKAQILQLGPT